MKRSATHSDRKKRTHATRNDEGKRRALARTDRPHPVESLHRAAGNQAVQRLVESRTGDAERTEETEATGNSSDHDAGGPLDRSLRGNGRPLDPRTRREMEERFGRSFGDVRIHDGDGALAATRALDADALAVGTDVVVRPDHASFESGPERLLLAHELAHVAQFDRSDGDAGERETSHPRDAAEREAARAAPRAAAGERVSVREAPSAPVATGALGWLEERAQDVGSAVSSATSSASSAVKSGASAAWEGAKSAGSAVKGTAESAWSATSDAYWGTVDAAADRMVEHGGPMGAIYEGMKENAGYVRQGGQWLEGKIDEGQDWMAGQAQSAADLAEGIPVLEQVADVGARGFDQYTQLGAGVLQGATSFGSGIVGMAANPVDTGKGLYQMGKHANFGPGITNPFKTAEGAYDLLAGNADFETVSQRLFDPTVAFEENVEFWSQMGSGIAEEYERSIGDDEDYMQAVGRAGLDIGSMFLGGGGAAAKASGTGGRMASRAASSASKAGRAGKSSQAARAGRGAGAARSATSASDDAIRISGRSGPDVQSRITTAGDEVLTTNQAMGRSGRVSAGKGYDSLTDMVRSDGTFDVPNLERRFGDYGGSLDRLEWAKHQTRGQASDILEQHLGPSFRRSGSSGRSTSGQGTAPSGTSRQRNPSARQSGASNPPDQPNFVRRELGQNWPYDRSVPNRSQLGKNVQRDHPKQVKVSMEQRTAPDGTQYYDRNFSKSQGELTVLEETGTGKPHTIKSNLERERIQKPFMEGNLASEGEIMRRVQEIVEEVNTRTGGYQNKAAVDRSLLSNQAALHASGPKVDIAAGAPRSLRQTRAELERHLGTPQEINADIDDVLRALEENGL